MIFLVVVVFLFENEEKIKDCSLCPQQKHVRTYTTYHACFYFTLYALKPTTPPLLAFSGFFISGISIINSIAY